MNRFLKTVRRGAAGLVAALLLSSCGGGDPVVAFKPTRLIVFGDELSAMESDGRKYTVNAVASATLTLPCVVNPTWFQRVANYYNLVLNECKAATTPASESRVYGRLGAKAVDAAAVNGLKEQVDGHAGGFTGADLVLMMIGQNDILEQYEAYAVAKTITLDQALAELRARGEAFAAQVSRVAAQGAKVIASTPVDLSYSPYARNRPTATEPNARADLGAMTAKFAEGLRYGLRNESGSQVALMLGNELTRLMGRSADEGFGSAYGLSDSKKAVCLATVSTLLDCTSETLIDPDGDPGTTEKASANAFLWADATRISPAGHNYLGSLAINRSTGNPF